MKTNSIFSLPAKYRRFSYNPSIIIALLLVANSCIHYWKDSTSSKKIDYFVLWAIPYCLPDIKSNNIYTVESKKNFALVLREKANSQGISATQKEITELVIQYWDGIIETTATPFLYTFFDLISSGDYDTDRMRFTIISMLCFIISFIILCYLFRINLLMSLLLLAFFLTLYIPLSSELIVGNVNQIQLLIITMFLWILVKSKHFYQVLIAGALIGIGIMFKPNILIMLVLIGILYLVNKRFQKLIAIIIGSCVGVLISILLSVLYFGQFEIWIHFIKALPDILDMSIPFTLGNYSLSSLVYSLAEINTSSTLLPLFIIIFLIVIWISRSKRSGKRQNSVSLNDLEKEEVFLATGIGCAITLLAMGLSWLHYYILLIPLLLLMIKPIADSSSGKIQILSVRILIVIALLQFSKLAGFFYITANLPYGYRVCFATLLITIIAYYKIWYQRKNKSWF